MGLLGFLSPQEFKMGLSWGKPTRTQDNSRVGVSSIMLTHIYICIITCVVYNIYYAHCSLVCNNPTTREPRDVRGPKSFPHNALLQEEFFVFGCGHCSATDFMMQNSRV